MTNVKRSGGGAGNKRSRMKKLILWIVLVIQIGLIFCFWCIQTSNPEHSTNEAAAILSTPVNKKNFNSSIMTKEKLKASPIKAAGVTQNAVHFVTNKKSQINKKEENSFKKSKPNILENVNNFMREYTQVKTHRLMNITGIEAEMTNDEYDIGIPKYVWCFQQGTINDTTSLQIYWNIDTQQVHCKCQKYWHGKDCGQPELIWRALMLPKNQFPQRTPNKAHFLIYIIEGYFCSLDFLELQIKSAVTVVDHFLIFWKSKNFKETNLKALRRKISEMLDTEHYTFYHCETANCNQTAAFSYFRNELNTKFGKTLKFTDLLLYTNGNVVLSTNALRFFKYYANIIEPTQLVPWQFRLKYNVYGFYWQHPAKTHLNGFLSSFSQLDSPNDLQRLLNQNRNSVGERIIGDLNHFGGWYCQYCSHPDEIIAELNEQEMSKDLVPTAIETQIKDRENFVQLPNTRNNFIDSKYLEYLIAQGLHIDGKTNLEKIRANSDAYYAPAYAEKQKWKFGTLLTNLFEALENDYVLDEAEGGFGF